MVVDSHHRGFVVRNEICMAKSTIKEVMHFDCLCCQNISSVPSSNLPPLSTSLAARLLFATPQATASPGWTCNADRFMDWLMVDSCGMKDQMLAKKCFGRKSPPERTQTARLSHRSRASDKLRVPDPRRWNWQSRHGLRPSRAWMDAKTVSISI